MNRTQWGLLGALFLSFSLLVDYNIKSSLLFSVALNTSIASTSTTRQVQVRAVTESSFNRTLSLRGNDPANAQEAPSTTTTSTSVSDTNNVSNVTIIPIVVDLTGELGNQLHHLAHGRAIQSMLLQQYGIASRIIPRRVSNGDKYMKTQRELKQCFPNLRKLNFYGPGTAPKQKELDRAQQAWLGEEAASRLVLHRGSGYNTTLQGLDALIEILRDDKYQATKPNVLSPPISSTSISLPFLHTESMSNRDFMDRMYDDYRDYFRFDDEACCADLPAPTESVFHFRNFLAEFRKNKQTGLEELSPHMVATEVFRKSNNATTTSTKIAIATRFLGRSRTDEYLETLQQHGFDTRLLSSNHSAMQDFCAMRNAPELVGMVRSTFVMWAALLGHGTARLYSVDSPATRRKYGVNKIFRAFQWTHPELQRRIRFELYQTEESLDNKTNKEEEEKSD
jgi:hypothetical protein